MKSSVSIDERHHPVEHARHEAVARDVRRQALALAPPCRSTSAGLALAVLREQHVAAMREQEQQPADQRRPEQVSMRCG